MYWRKPLYFLTTAKWCVAIALFFNFNSAGDSLSTATPQVSIAIGYSKEIGNRDDFAALL